MGKENETSETPGDFKLVGFSNFVRTNSRSDLFKVNRFHHVEFWCSDATNTARPSMDVNLSHTATASIPTFNHETCRNFSAKHGLAVRAIAIEVDDAELAFTTSVAHGAKPSASPILLDNGAVITERYVSYSNSENDDSSPDNWFLPKFEAVSSFPLDYGIRRLDHAVGNEFTGFHEFADFTAEDVGTSESGLNAVVLANNEETVLLPMNEPVFGTKRKSQIQTYLEHNEGAGVQHLPLVSEDIFRTLREMRKCSAVEGFEFMPSPPPTYYENLKNDQGTLLQIFTKPVGDRPTIFIEIIQRVGCMLKDEKGREYQKSGCGGFGKGNFSELFKSIEEYEKTLEAKRISETTSA
ncbi:hypothetical protein POPTR_005G205200v4 [Populus trichocarpa]|uniref:Uncharacterized protein n=1 Tax=Populus trichocarpa TaxID=3694 RepID=A0ACC0T140_POPTR|nr:hypothetical protein POPTR_005G205200v4 [Populus trichocarpa]